MVFGLFHRKSNAGDTAASPESRTNRLPTPTPSVVSVAHHSPLRFSTTIRAVLGGSTTDLTDTVAEGGSHTHSPAPPPPDTPTPPPVGPNDTKALHDLMLTIPPKTLHAYTLAHLRPQSPLLTSPALELHTGDLPRPLSPTTVTKLTTFFSTLAPPPLLHCMRCHKDFFDVENEEKDKACRVAHDDESALVSRITGGGYETLWGCCGQTASGDGSEGPPDGWCYEGKHTTDIRRARFRSDSTLHDDKLTSCLKLNCRGIRDQLPRPDRFSPPRNAGTSSARRCNPSPVRSLASRSTRKRPRKSLKDASSSEDEEGTTSRAAKAKPKEKASGDAGEGDKDKDIMAVDESNLPPKPSVKAKSRPISRAKPPVRTSTMASLSASGTASSPAVSSKSKSMTKPKSTSRTLLSQSHTHLASDSEVSTQSRPRTRSLVREESRVRDGSRTRSASKITKADISERTRRARKVIQALSQSEEEPEATTGESEQEGRGRDRKKRRVVRG